MMRNRIHDLLAGIGATLALLAVVVGVPVALATTVGWPLPRSLPSAGGVVTALRYGQVPSSTVLASLGLLLWVTWALTVASIGAEVVAVARGTVARGLPGVAGLQALATRLVAAVMLLLPLATRAAAAPAPPPAPIVASDVDDAHVTPATEPADDRVMWIVQPRESLWTIAERLLGDGRRWHEIVELNTGRAQPDGGRLRAGDTLIHPGWRLALPADARTPSPTPATLRVEPGDDLWELAERHLDDGDRWRELYEANRGRTQPDGERLTDPDLIRPGWTLRLPAVDEPGGRADPERERPDATPGPGRPDARVANGRAASGAAPPAVPDTPARRGDIPTGDNASARPRTRTAAPEPSLPGEGRADQGGESAAATAPIAERPVTPSTIRRLERAAEQDPTLRPTAAQRRAGPAADEALAIGGAAVLAAGLVGLIVQRRRHWLRRRSQAGVPAPVDPETAELERWLRSMAEHDLAQRVDRVTRLLTDLAGHLEPAPPITAIELGERTVLHLRSSDHTPPPGLAASGDGRRWLLAPEREVAQPDATRRHLPALVSCGQTAEDALVMADLCGGPALGVTGPDAQVREALTSWAAELASTGADVGVELVVVGPHDPLVERLARVTIVDDLHAALTRVRRVLDEASDGDTGRIVVLCGFAPPDTTLDTLLAHADDPRVAVVLPSDSMPRRLVLEDHRVALEPDGLSLATPRWLTPDDWDRFGDLLRQPAPTYAPELVPSPLTARGTRVDWAPSFDGDDDDAPIVTVGVLGPVVVDGQPAPLGPDALALLTWLAVHRTGADPTTIQETLWPTAPSDGSRLWAACEDITALLADGVNRPIVHTDDGRLELADAVGADVARFDVLLRRLDAASPATQARRMAEALALVRGEPFSDGADWAHADGLAVATAARVTEVAHRLAMHALAVLDVDRAAWAVERGLWAVPGCELLFRDRMRIADACGDPAAVDAAMDELRVHLDGAWPSAETERLHAQLGRGRARRMSDDLPDAM